MNAISYGLVAVLVALAIIGALSRVGTGLETTFCHVGAGLHHGPTVTTCGVQVRK